MRAGVPCLAAYERANGWGLIATDCACVAFSLMLMFHRATGCRVVDGVDISHCFTCCRSALQSMSASGKATVSHTLRCYLLGQMCRIPLAVSVSCHWPATRKEQSFAAGLPEKRVKLQNKYCLQTFDLINQSKQKGIAALKFSFLGNDDKARNSNSFNLFGILT